ncbi:MAG: TonB-dependent receptor, partial [Bacteroidia bacterium]|nr:TonB-dependent receptor [Bacteroidia bacterium]
MIAQQITVTGRVTDGSNGEAIIGATVKVNESGAITNEDGRYTVTIAKKDTIKISVTYEGYSDVNDRIIRPTGTTIEKNVEMAIKNTTTEDVVVTAAKIEQKKEDLTISVETLTPKKLDIQASTDLQRTMEQTPGVQINDRQVSIRGSSGYTYGAGSRVLTLLDGLPMISADRNSVNFDMLPTDNIRQVEVVKGASSVLFGAGAMGGVINVLTQDPTSKPKTSIRLRYEVYDNPRNDTANWDGRSSATSPSLHFFHSRKIKERFDLTTQLDLIKNSGYRYEEFSNRLRALVMTKYYFPKVQGLYIGLNVQANFDSSSSFLAWGGYPSKALIAGSGFLSYQWLVRLAVDPSVSYLTKSGNRHVYRGRWFHQINKISTGQSGTSTLHYHEYQYAHGFGKKRNINLIGGANWTQNHVKADSTFGLAISNQYAAFLQAEMKFFERLNISLGARYQYEQIEGDDLKKDSTGTYTRFYRDSTGVERPSTLVDPGQFVRADHVKQTTINEPVFRAGVSFR